jgi:hypothetical protein
MKPLQPASCPNLLGELLIPLEALMQEAQSRIRVLARRRVNWLENWVGLSPPPVWCPGLTLNQTMLNCSQQWLLLREE